MNLFLIRHGESTGNLAGKIQGSSDYPLSDLGRKQAEYVADYLKDLQLDYIYSSDLSRAYHTAEVIAKKQKKSVHKWEKVREVHLGPLQGLTRAEIYEKFPQTVDYSILTSGILGTETIEALTNRCQYVIDQLQMAHKNHHIAIVSHGGFISIFLMYLIAGEQWHKLHRPFQIGNTSISHIEWPRNRTKPIIHYINQTGHLDTLNHKTNNIGLL
jgi:uncharacterized phosphatase